MSLFSRIGKIFGEKEREKIPVQEALRMIEIQRSEKMAAITDESYKNSVQIYSEIQGLRSAIADLKKVRVEEKRASASTDVKDKFCAAAEKQLSAIEKPEKDMEKILAFAAGTEKTFSSLGGLTPKQMMHIGFFFKGDVAAIARKITGINDLLQKIKTDAESLRKYDKVLKMNNELISLEKDGAEMEKKMESLKNELSKLRSDVHEIDSEIGNIDLTKLQETEKAVADTESKKSLAEQDMFFYISIDKMLKKLRHGEKIRDEMLEAYIRAPAEAIISDNEGKIFSFAEQILKLNDSNSIDLDEKSILKLKQIIENRRHVEQKRSDLVNLIAAMKAKKNDLRLARDAVEEKRKKLELSKISAERQINEGSRELERLSSELNAARNKAESRRIEMKMMAEHLTSSEIE